MENQLSAHFPRDPPGHPQIGSVLALLSLTRLYLKQWDKAEPILRECVKQREKQMPGAWQLANTQSMLG